MSSKWKNRLLSEIVEINPKRTIKKGETTPFIDMAALPINSRDVDVAICSREYKGGGSKFQNGDTLVARITPCLENGKTALINCLSNDTIAHGSTEFIVLAARDQREFQFVYYLARSDPFRSYAIARMEGTSGRQRVPNTAVGDYEFFCPPADQRVAIGRFLANLDDRITLLRETNKTLEAIAQAIFKSWFVDFDPVRAKMEGRQPEGMDEATAALFPDSFEESELGLVPKGWRVEALSNVCNISSGKRPPSRSDVISPQHTTPLYGGAGLMGYTTTSLFNEKLIVTGRVGTLGKVHIAYPPFWASDNVLVLRVKPPLSFHFVFHWTKSIDLHTLNRGSTQPLLTQKDLGKQLHAFPTQPILDVFESFAQILYARIYSNITQANALSSLRDTLLPRLISGQLRLPEAQEQIENA